MKAQSPLEPDVLATDHRSMPGEAEVRGEKRLCLALLQDALELALEKIPARLCERDEALGWIRSDSDGPFGFERVCSELGLDPSKIRRKVEEQLALAASESAFVAKNGDGKRALPGKREAPPSTLPPASRRRPRRPPVRRLCTACGAPLRGPWRQKLPRGAPLGEDVQAVGTVTLRLCTGCVTLFVEGRFIGEIRPGSRP